MSASAQLPPTSGDGGASRVKVIEAIRTPLGFFSLVVLVCEGILGFLAARATGSNFTILIWGMLGLLFALVGAVVFVSTRTVVSITPAAEDTTLAEIVDEYQYMVDRIIAVPVASWDEPTLLGECKALVTTIRGFREYAISLRNLLNSQVDDLGGFLESVEGKGRYELSRNEKAQLQYILAAIRAALPAKSLDASMKLEQLKILLRQRRAVRKNEPPPSSAPPPAAPPPVAPPPSSPPASAPPAAMA